MIVYCNETECEWYESGFCNKDELYISNLDMRADGFYPRCDDFVICEDNEEK